MIAQTAGRHRQLELDAAAFALSSRVLSSVLGGGAHLTRDVLYAHLDRAGLATVNQRGYHLLVHAAQTGLICCGAPHAGQPTFVLLDAWVPPAPAKTRDEALAELARRYVLGHGPVTLADLMRWARLTMADARLAIAGAGTAIAHTRIAEVDYLMAPDALDGVTEAGDSVHLLAGFDEYLLGYAGRDAVLDPAQADVISPGGNGVFTPTVLVNGRVHGTWWRENKRGQLRLSRAMFKPIPRRAMPLLVETTARYAQYAGLPAVWGAG